MALRYDCFLLQRKANKELMQEQVQQKKRLTQQMNQTHTVRMEHQRAVSKHTDLQKVCKVSL